MTRQDKPGNMEHVDTNKTTDWGDTRRDTRTDTGDATDRLHRGQEKTYEQGEID